MIRFRCLMFQRYNHFLFCQYFFKTLTKIFFQTLFFAPLQPYLIHYAGNIQNHIVLKGEQGRAAPRHAARYLPAPRPLLPAAPPLLCQRPSIGGNAAGDYQAAYGALRFQNIGGVPVGVWGRCAGQGGQGGVLMG